MRTTLAMLSLFISTVAAQEPAFVRNVDPYVARVMQTFEVPGIALAIVKDGRVIVAKGYGVRTVGQSAPVDARTIFCIASNTKAFTATAIGLLVEEGKLQWDAPVTRYLPSFALSDPYVTHEITLRDLLVHRSGLGLGAGDLLWWPGATYTRKEIVQRLRFIPLATSFRSTYAYNNVLYLVAGEVIEAVSGMPWEDFIRTRILDPVGMTHTTLVNQYLSTEDRATTHASVDGHVRIVSPDTGTAMNPAGGIYACAEDMAKWMITQLDSGQTPAGKRLFSPRTTKQLWSMVTPIPIGNPAPGLEAVQPDFVGYALGFSVRDYRGYKMVSHTGGMPGFVSRVTMIPELGLGITVLTNQESGAAFNTLTNAILDAYMPGPRIDWLAVSTALNARSDSLNRAAVSSAAAARDSLSHPSLPLAKYAGTYRDAWYGDIRIAYADGRLSIAFSRTPLLSGELQHWQYDTFIARWKDRELRADAYVTFALNPDGSVDRIRMQAASPETDFSFDFQDLLLKPVAAP